MQLDTLDLVQCLGGEITLSAVGAIDYRDILNSDMRVETHCAAEQMGPFAQPGERRGMHPVAGLA
jgi:hypothetical protein